MRRIATMNRTRGEKFGDRANSPENEYEIEQFADNNGWDNGKVLSEIRCTEEILRQVQRELCLIKLCWSDIPITKDLYAQSLPDTYRCVNDKERLLLWYAENFRRQIHAKDANRRPLFLACENECGVQKFTSTGIRRSTPPYPELYTWHGCAQFISNHITYQPLNEEFIMVSI
ncbi:dynein regulatory complex subunit 7-like [Formica exsecta]|uniref:dynein regulatory complex subunit 7-like n=1 Tax=Formica exsecta TaxID=72781 RepID=UPI001142C23C|nr:dynein regulatory complex subunit 7-like [Formica exsecta]